MSRAAGVNLFESLEIELVQILDDGSDGTCDLVFRAVVGRPPLRVSIAPDLRIAVSDDAANASLSFDIARLASPGASVQLGSRRLHLQFLRARHPFYRGPLLMFEDGVPLPCFKPSETKRFWRRWAGAALSSKAVLPVFIFAGGTDDEHRHEIKAGLSLAVNLLKGAASAGLDDTAYFAD